MITEEDMMHGQDYNRQDVSGWLMGEKLHGCRAYWDGTTMWSRGGKVINIPAEMREQLPDYPLDGEIYAGDNGFELARRAVQYNDWTPQVRFAVFDAPAAFGDYMERYHFIRSSVGMNSRVFFITHVQIKDINDAAAWLTIVQKHGGEGVVLRNPFNMYQPGRTSEILKLKQWVAP